MKAVVRLGPSRAVSTLTPPFPARSLSDLSSEVEALVARVAALTVNRDELQGRASQAARSVPELEAAKKAAAQRKDFKVRGVGVDGGRQEEGEAGAK